MTGEISTAITGESWTTPYTRNEDSIGNLSSHRFALVIDDTLVDHPYAEKMEGVSSFYDATKRRYIQGHQLVTAILVDIETNEIHPVNLSAYSISDKYMNNEFYT